MQKRRVDYTIFYPKANGFDFYSDILFTTEKLYQDNPQLVARFHRASLRGWDYAFTHIDEAVDIIMKQYNTQNRDRDALWFEATDLQAAAVEMEKLVRGQTAETTSDKELKRKFSELENVIQHALNAVKTIDPIVEKKTIGIRKAAIASLPLDLLQKVTESIKAAVELGDVIKIKSIAEELKLETDTLAPFCDELVRLAEDFDFDGIQRFMLEFGS
jgi:hypothetical protein